MKRSKFESNVKRRQEEALKRNEVWRKLTPEQKIKDLDIRFGKDTGAAKQRAKINKLIEKGV